MSFNPLEQAGIPVEEQFRNWSELNVSPTTRARSTRTPARG